MYSLFTEYYHVGCQKKGLNQHFSKLVLASGVAALFVLISNSSFSSCAIPPLGDFRDPVRIYASVQRRDVKFWLKCLKDTFFNNHDECFKFSIQRA